MKKLLSIGAVLGMAIVGGAMLTGCTSPKSASAPDTGNIAYAGYTEYSPEALAKAVVEEKDVAVFFHSKTCGSCAKLEADILANVGSIPADVEILKADRDENQDLAATYNVDKYHTVAYMGANQKNVKGLFTLDEVLREFDAPAALKIVPKPAAVKVAGYTEYSAAAVDAATKEGKDIALFFHSKTCGSCAKLDADIVANGKNIPADVAVFKTDRDDNQDLAVTYGVDKYHTVAYMGDNKKNVKGLFTLDDLVKEFDAPAVVSLKSYDTYAPEFVEEATAQGKRVVLNFRAERCPTCKKTSEEIIAMQDKIPSDVIVLETDYDTYTQLKKDYGVVKQTTFVFLKADGSFDKTVVNVRGIDDLLAELG